jgi:hypothetical protein
MRKLSISELGSIEGGITFDCGLAAFGVLVTAGAILVAPPIGLAAGALGVGGLVGGMVGLSRSCTITRYESNGGVNSHEFLVRNF